MPGIHSKWTGYSAPGQDILDHKTTVLWFYNAPPGKEPDNARVNCDYLKSEFSFNVAIYSNTTEMLVNQVKQASTNKGTSGLLVIITAYSSDDGILDCESVPLPYRTIEKLICVENLNNKPKVVCLETFNKGPHLGREVRPRYSVSETGDTSYLVWSVHGSKEVDFFKQLIASIKKRTTDGNCANLEDCLQDSVKRNGGDDTSRIYKVSKLSNDIILQPNKVDRAAARHADSDNGEVIFDEINTPLKPEDFNDQAKLQTFRNFNHLLTKMRCEILNAGFVALAYWTKEFDLDELMCVRCGLIIWNISESLDLLYAHQKLTNGDCDFLKSFRKHPHPPGDVQGESNQMVTRNKQLPKELTIKPESDYPSLRNSFIADWDLNVGPSLLNMEHSDVSKSQMDGLGVIARPKELNYAMVKEETRLNSFLTFDKDKPVRPPEEFVKAGLFWTGVGLMMKCFACDFARDDWLENVDPLQRHFEERRNCPFFGAPSKEDYSKLANKIPNEVTNNNSSDVVDNEIADAGDIRNLRSLKHRFAETMPPT